MQYQRKIQETINDEGVKISQANQLKLLPRLIHDPSIDFKSVVAFSGIMVAIVIMIFWQVILTYFEVLNI